MQQKAELVLVILLYYFFISYTTSFPLYLTVISLIIIIPVGVHVSGAAPFTSFLVLTLAQVMKFRETKI